MLFEKTETLISYNVWNDGAQQDCLYIEQGHLMTCSMVIDPRHSVVVSWTPVRLSSMLPQGSPSLCPPGLQFSTSSERYAVSLLMPYPTKPKGGWQCP